MDSNKHLIIHLLIQQMKHEQLMYGLQQLGFRNETYELDLSGVIAELMGIPETDITWNWMDAYMDFMRKAMCYELKEGEKSLVPLAEKAFEKLKV